MPRGEKIQDDETDDHAVAADVDSSGIVDDDLEGASNDTAATEWHQARTKIKCGNGKGGATGRYEDVRFIDKLINDTNCVADRIISSGANANRKLHDETMHKLALFLQHLGSDSKSHTACRKRLDQLASLHAKRRNSQ